MDRGRHMGIAEVEHIGARGIEKRRVERVDALAPADQARLAAAGKFSERLQRDLESFVAAAGQGHGEKIEKRALGLMHDLGRQIAPPRLHHQPSEPLGHAGNVQHGCPLSRGQHRPAGAKLQARRQTSATLNVVNDFA